MRVHQHKTNNMLLKSPDGMVNCDTVPATLVFDTETETRICTYWRPSEEELAALNKGHSVCLHVFGRAHPPVSITVEAP